MQLRCTVRGCGAALLPRGRGLACACGHAFDRAASGYVNLLQPQDRRSLAAGDAKETVAARRRLIDAGAADALLACLAATVAGCGLPPGARAVDVGSGEGSLLGGLAGRLGLDAAGIDLSAHAAALAARRHPGLLWLVANADRGLPLADASVQLVLSLTGRRNPAECARVLAPGGRLVVAVPAADDLAELREAVLGGASREDRTAAVVAEHAPRFVELCRAEARQRRRFPRALLEDLLTATYRGGRAGRRERLADLDALEVTLSQAVLVFGARPG
jgi:23S rRNA (guanine745-N1)-methyltransferase